MNNAVSLHDDIIVLNSTFQSFSKVVMISTLPAPHRKGWKRKPLLIKIYLADWVETLILMKRTYKWSCSSVHWSEIGRGQLRSTTLVHRLMRRKGRNYRNSMTITTWKNTYFAWLSNTTYGTHGHHNDRHWVSCRWNDNWRGNPGCGIMVQALAKVKSYDKKAEDWHFAYTMFNKLLVSIGEHVRTGNMDVEAELLKKMTIMDEIVIDLSVTPHHPQI